MNQQPDMCSVRMPRSEAHGYRRYRQLVNQARDNGGELWVRIQVVGDQVSLDPRGPDVD